jgi:hypothetical protein
MSLREVLVQLARTAAMVLAGAAALLLVLHVVAGLPNGHLLVVIVLAAPLGALFGWVTMRALRSGELPYRFGVDRRDRNPVAFWTGVAIYAAGAAVLVAISLWALVQVVTGWAG